jgi:hypothetical protein
MEFTRRRWPRSAVFGAIIAIVLLLQPLMSPPTPVQAQSINPRDLAVTDDEAGKQATRTLDQEGSDGRSSWVRLQWERNIEGPDALTGPWTVHSSVWVAQDFTSARAIFKEQSTKNKDFPEAYYGRGGTFALPLKGVGSESAGLSACVDCSVKDEIRLHHRVVIRWGVVVQVLYLYGSDKVNPQDLAQWYVSQLDARIPGEARTAPEVVGQAPTTESTPAPADILMVVDAPKEFVVTLEEAGKRAKVEREKAGKDARGNWYEVRYERGGTGSRFYEGPVTVYSYVHVAKDVESARQVYQEQIRLNEKFPEANKRIGDKFELKGSEGIADESQGLSACERRCNLDGDIYVHKRLVFRSYNAVSVVYLYGLLVDEGNTDFHAVNFSEMVLRRFTR